MNNQKENTMEISPLSTNLINLLSSDKLSLDTSENNGTLVGNFADILSESLNTAAQADAADKISSLQLLTDQSDNLSGLLLDAQKAELSLNLALQIRNKVIDAYNEIMRMQV